MSERQTPEQGGVSFLPMMLAVFVAGFFCLAMILLTGGFFFYICGVVLGMVMLGMFHYVVWGRAMSEAVAGQREEMELLEKAKEKFHDRDRGPDWTYRR